MKKKETNLSVLKEIRDMMREHWYTDKQPKITKDWQDAHFETINLENQALPKNVPEVPSGHFLIYIPSLTMQEIVEKAGNKAADGRPLMYNKDGWYKDEKFYTQEKSKTGWRVVSGALLGKGLNWNTQEEEIKKLGGQRLNAAEELYIQYAYDKVKGVRLTYGSHVIPYGWEYSWTSSLSSRGDVVFVGGFGGHGGNVHNDDPRYVYDGLGFRFSRSVS